MSGWEDPAGLKDSWNSGSRDSDRKIGSGGQSEILESESYRGLAVIGNTKSRP